MSGLRREPQEGWLWGNEGRFRAGHQPSRCSWCASDVVQAKREPFYRCPNCDDPYGRSTKQEAA